LKIGYLMNSYPMTSTTFIRREMESLEALGVEIKRYAVRHWSEPLVDPIDIQAQSETHYLLTGNATNLLLSFIVVFFTNPIGLIKGINLWQKVCRNAGFLSVKHFAYLLQATYFYRKSHQDQIEHVHVHFSTNATTVAMIAHAMGGVSYSFTAHGPDEFVDPTTISMHLKVQHAAFVVAISNYCRVQLVRFSSYAYWDKIVIAHCGIHLNEFVPSFTFEADNQSFVCVGRLCPQKAQLLFPPAVAALKSEFPKLHIHLIGDGESRSALEASIKQHQVESFFTLHGWKANIEVREMVKQNRALLLPSFAEGLPVVIMEAFALGRPVISTYIAGIPELVDERCGWMIPAGSIEAISQAIRSALQASPKELTVKGKEGRYRVEREHNLKTIAPKLLATINQYKSH
jgi:colanic acid/amylovoran biosynthesis glycosyltransferase